MYFFNIVCNTATKIRHLFVDFIGLICYTGFEVIL